MAKNYAMGAMISAPFIAMCMEAIFGVDIDILSWDSDMTDGRDISKFEMYAQRAGIHPTKPILFSFDRGYQKEELHRDLEEAGMAMFRIFVTNVVKDLPDSEKVDPMKLPPGLQYFVCDGHAEKGNCDKDRKWDTNKVYPNLRYQTVWHPGWKYHQFTGHLLAYFMVENLFDSLNELTKKQDDLKEVMTPSISNAYLSYLLSLEVNDKEKFLATEVPKNYKHLVEIGLEIPFHRSNVVCRTSYLPSQARYDGLVTERVIIYMQERHHIKKKGIYFN